MHTHTHNFSLDILQGLYEKNKKACGSIEKTKQTDFSINTNKLDGGFPPSNGTHHCQNKTDQRLQALIEKGFSTMFLQRKLINQLTYFEQGWPHIDQNSAGPC